ncbi:MAG: ATP-binding protein [Oscillospiraceae bacterium]|nr:ATP-binding protein [Ruminococcus sp.]MBP1564536.1 ATP-binding protein [Oscillospiraceae bacterium]MBQ9981853.1 ATP-binding protein [Oscillospiraceae bacterium]
MIKLITGEKGTGKTKIIIDMMNEAVKSTNGNLVCIEKGANLRTQISYKVRWCDTEYFKVEGFDAFYGFVAGMLAGNYDIKEIFVDGILKIGGRDYEALGNMLEKLSALTGEETTIVFTVSANESDMPQSVTKFIG